MMNFKSLLHKNTIARYNYEKKFKPIGVSFSEYCDYIYHPVSRNKPGFHRTKLFGHEIHKISNYSYIQNVEEVLVDEIYKFNKTNNNPIIIDCGANIGLSIIYFKRLYPNAEIIAFEPDNSIYSICLKNLESFNYHDVNVINAAVWNKDTILTFLPNNSLGGMLVDQSYTGRTENVKAIRLKNLLNKKVDMLKIDIEGAELEVLEDCQDKLNNVENLFIEYHSDANKPQKLQDILKILSNCGFRYYIKHAWDFMNHPFVEYKNGTNNDFDLQLNIFAYKND